MNCATKKKVELTNVNYCISCNNELFQENTSANENSVVLLLRERSNVNGIMNQFLNDLSL